MNDRAIACTLDARSLKDRLAWITSLNARALKSASRTDLTLTLEYDRSWAEDVRKMIAGEQACCAFLRFTIVDRPDSLSVSIIAPEEEREAAEALFEPFAAREPITAAKPCGCQSECGA